MINAIRVLLKNVNGDAASDLSSPLTEPGDPAFRARQLPTWLAAGYRGLFGSNPDSFYLDYRVSELITLIAASPLADIRTLKDSRTTDEPLFKQATLSFTPTIVKNADSDSHSFNCSNGGDADDIRGRSWYHYNIAVSGGAVTLTSAFGDNYTVNAVNGVLRLTAPNGLRISIAPTSGTASWTISGYNQPRGLHMALREFADQVSPWFDLMIAPETKDETLQRIREVWHRRPQADYPNRMAAILLAAALYIDTLPE